MSTLEEMLAACTLVDMQIVHIWGTLAEYMNGDIPEEWSLELTPSGRIDGNRMQARAAVQVDGPGGSITVDGVATFEGPGEWGDLGEDGVNQFLVDVGIPTIAPTVRAAYEDIRVRLQMEDAPRFGLVRARHQPTESA